MGRSQVPRGRAREGRARVPAHPRESARRGELVPRAAAASRRRRCHRARRHRPPRRARLGSVRARASSCHRRARARPTPRSSVSSTSLRDARRRSRRARRDRGAPAMYDAILRERYDRVEPRLADLDQLESIAAKFPSRAAFLSELALEPPSATQDLAGGSGTEDDALILSTAHSAKGREWDAVFVIWAVDGWFPSSRALRSDEETGGGTPPHVRRDDARAASSRGALSAQQLRLALGQRLLHRSALALHRRRRARSHASHGGVSRARAVARDRSSRPARRSTCARYCAADSALPDVT